MQVESLLPGCITAWPFKKGNSSSQPPQELLETKTWTSPWFLASTPARAAADGSSVYSVSNSVWHEPGTEWYPPKAGQQLHLHLIMCFGAVSPDTQWQGGVHSEQQQCLSAHSSLNSTSMSQCLSHAWPNLDFCHTTGWPCSWGCCSKLSIANLQSANFDLPVCFASPSATIKFTKEKVQEERWKPWLQSKQGQASSGVNSLPEDQSNSPWLQWALKSPRSSSWKLLPWSLPFFCSLLHCLTYSSPWARLLLQPIHGTEKCFY